MDVVQKRLFGPNHWYPRVGLRINLRIGPMNLESFTYEKMLCSPQKNSLGHLELYPIPANMSDTERLEAHDRPRGGNVRAHFGERVNIADSRIAPLHAGSGEHDKRILL